MKRLLVSQNHQCLLASFAMVMDANPDQWVKDFLGHDGTERINSDPEPWCFRGFHPQEFVEIIVNVYGYPVTMFSKIPKIMRFGGKVTDGRPCHEWKHYIRNNKGVVCGVTNSGVGHAVANFEGMFYDPRGQVYDWSDIHDKNFEPEHFFLVGDPK